MEYVSQLSDGSPLLALTEGERAGIVLGICENLVQMLLSGASDKYQLKDVCFVVKMNTKEVIAHTLESVIRLLEPSQTYAQVLASLRDRNSMEEHNVFVVILSGDNVFLTTAFDLKDANESLGKTAGQA